YGQVLLSCATFGDALRQTQRFEALAHDLGRSELQQAGDQAEYRWHSPWAADCPALPLSVLSGIQAFGSWMAQRPLAVQLIALPFAAPPAADAAALAEQLGAPLSFDAPCTAARFDAALLHEPIPSSDPLQLPLLQQHAERLLAQQQAGASTRLAERVQHELAPLLALGEARLDALAERLQMAPRTLQRRLALEGRPFQQLLDATRRELAAQYLRNASLSLTEIAFLLGYAEQSSFSHAHRAWHGCSPQQWRLRQH
ncbi:MAG: AraC family transcriptional regulator ligand-binding domain-containing protein, partial [Burkholderiales bacterium]|nr:AraC family transcriptional regulator ligand-binding domain-containing protein [Burkholderiales bacterium]